MREQFRRNRVGLLFGEASFVDEHTICIRDDDDGVKEVTADNIVIATGTSPARPKDVEFDDQTIIDSDGLLQIQQRLPRSMTVVGAGVIGVEYASMFGRLGTKVTVVDQRPRVLTFLDGEIGEALQFILRRNNVTFRLNEAVKSVAMTNNGTVTHLASGKAVASETVLYATGRQGDTASLALDKVGIEADKRGRISVDDEYRTAVPHIFGVGDCTGGFGLAATAMEQGRLAALHAFGRPVSTMPELLPTGVYAIPEIAMVGRTEEDLTEAGRPLRGRDRALVGARPRPDDRRRGRHAQAARLDRRPRAARRPRARHRRRRPRAHRPGGDGRRGGRRLPRPRGLQLPDVRRGLQGGRARRGQPDGLR